jgi:hypothetical protein
VLTETITERLPRSLSRPTPRALLRSSPALVVYAVIAVAWLLVAPRSPDLAAQVYRTYLFSHFGMLVWDNSWYGGHPVPGYSLLYPPLSELLGVRLLGVLTVLASTALFSRIVTILYGRGSTLGSVFFAVAAAGDLWIGRITFALGVTFALASMLAMLSGARRSRIALSALLGALSAVASPVAGVMLALAFATEIVAKRRLRPGAVVIVVVVVVLLPLEFFFPEGGFEPYGFNSFVAASAVALGFVWALPRRERTLRIGGAIFFVLNALALLPTPLGSNIVRYAVLLAGPLLVCALTREPDAEGALESARGEGAGARARAGGAGAREKHAALSAGDEHVRARVARTLAALSPVRLPERRPSPAVVLVLVGIAFWVVWGPITQTQEVLGDRSTKASFYVPVRHFIERHAKGRPVRIEVPFTRSHWESALLAPYVSLARGWERQLDKRYDEAIEADPLKPAVYHAWLAHDGVSYVALPDVPLDGSSIGEAALIRHGTPFLKRMYSGGGWQIYKVLSSRPLAEGPGTLVALGHDGFTLRARAAGSFLVRVHYTHYWSVIAGSAEVEPGTGGWTKVRTTKPGKINVQARFSLAAALEEL